MSKRKYPVTGDRAHTIPTGSHVLCFDPRDNDWSLWRIDLECDTMLVHWDGHAELDDPQTDRNKTWSDRWLLWRISRKQVDACIMAAIHLDTNRWQCFAARMVGYQQEKNHVET